MFDSNDISEALEICLSEKSVLLIKTLVDCNIFNKQLINELLTDDIYLLRYENIAEYLIDNNIIEKDSYLVLSELCIQKNWIRLLLKIINYDFDLNSLNINTIFMLPDELFYKYINIPDQLTFDQIFAFPSCSKSNNKIKTYCDQMIFTDEQLYLFISKCIWSHNDEMVIYLVNFVHNPMIIYMILIGVTPRIAKKYILILLDHYDKLKIITKSEIFVLCSYNYINHYNIIASRYLPDSKIWSKNILQESYEKTYISNISWEQIIIKKIENLITYYETNLPHIY